MASIFLAVGHGRSTDGSWDSGCVDGSYNEADLMFDIAGAAVSILRQHGVNVVTDHDTGNDRNITYTVRDANAAGVDAYVSLHCDFNGAPTGTYPIIYPGAGQAMNLANAINASVMLRMGLGTRGVLQRDDYEVSNTDMPACIFETGSIRTDINKLLDYNKYGQAVAFGIMDYFGIKYDGSAQPPSGGGSTGGFISIYNSNYYLSYGDGPSEDIKQFQRDCNFCGYQGENGALTVDGLYGSECRYACECIQRWNGLAIDGEYGVNTDLALMREIAMIQEALNKAGFKCSIDGASGTETVNALKAFQKAKGLTVDGICGNDTRAALGIK